MNTDTASTEVQKATLEAENLALRERIAALEQQRQRQHRQYQRSIVARKEAEQIMEAKSLELYEANQQLTLFNRQLENLVAIRTEEINQSLKDLEKANRDIHQFTYLASHDLKTPLRAIGSLLGFVEQDLYDFPEALQSVREPLQLIRDRINRMNLLLNSILEYSSIGRREQQLENLEIRYILQNTIEEQANNNQHTYRLKGDFPTIRVNRQRLYQIFRHVLDNAVLYHHDPENIIIEIEGKRTEQWLEISITDNGAGIPERYQQRIFEIFQTLSTKDRNKGSIGMGLPMVRRIMEEEMKGRFFLTSREGEGATFTFCFPLSIIVS